MIWKLGHLYTPHIWGWGALAHLSGILVSVSTSIVGLLLIALDGFLCSFIISQVSIPWL